MTIDAHVEMFYNDTWNDVTADLRYRQGIEIDYGQPDWTSTADPTEVKLTLKNDAAKYSPLDPNSELFGKIGRGTPLRVRIGDPQTGMALPGADDSYASTPDHASLDIAGDIDMRIEVTPDSWRPAAGDFLSFARKYETAGDQRSWGWWLNELGEVRVRWSPDGTFTNAITKTSTAVIPEASGRLAIRWTLDVDNGAAGNDVKFYTAPSLAGPWTQLGATVTTAGVTSIFASTVPLEVGRTSGPGATGVVDAPFAGRIHAFELRNGIDGTVVASPDFSAREPGDDTAFTDGAGRTWTLNGQAAITDPSLRASVAAVSWQPAWDETANDAVQSIVAAGILRRLGQGQEPLRSSLFRDLSDRLSVVAYWPLEEGSDATTFASGLQGDTSTLRVSRDVTPANFDGFAASEPVPTVDAGFISGHIPAYSGAADQRLFFLVHVPPEGVAGDRVLALMRTSGAIARWDIVISSAGSLKVRGFDEEDVLVFDDGFVAFGINGKQLMVSFWLQQSGSTTNWQLATFEAKASAADTRSGSQTTTYGRFRTIQVGTTADAAGTAYGHIGILNDDVQSIWDLIGSSLAAWSGETAGDRLLRLTGEEGVPLRLVGVAADTELLGPQATTELLNLLEDAPAVDLGPFGERRDAPALLYRGHADLYNQEPAITLDMSGGVIVNPFDPPLDDQRVRNDVTVSRVNGSSARAVRETGPLSVLDPPDGIGGRYKSADTLNVHSDGQLRDQAGWRLHLGTVDEHRIASLEIVMERHPELQQAVLELQAGDLIRITNPVAGLPPGPLDLIALGWSERITPHKWRITINCEPGSPWTVGEVSDGTDEQRVDTDGSETAASFVAGTDTSLPVAVTAGPRWTTDAGEFPLEIRTGGVVLNVTDIENIDDTFTRVEANGWGTADSGQAWTIRDGTAANFSVDGADAAVSLGAVSDPHIITLGVNVADVDMTATVSVDAVATGGPILPALLARWQANENVYQLRAEFHTSGNLHLSLYLIENGAFVHLATASNIATYTAGQAFRIRFQVVGTQFKGKIWDASSSEPAAWNIDVTNSVITAAGPIGTRNVLAGSNTNALPVVASWDSLTAVDQIFAVDATPVNGVTKTIPAGSDVRLAHPMIIGL